MHGKFEKITPAGSARRQVIEWTAQLPATQRGATTAVVEAGCQLTRNNPTAWAETVVLADRCCAGQPSAQVRTITLPERVIQSQANRRVDLEAVKFNWLGPPQAR
jgi:hypothetical protein